MANLTQTPTSSNVTKRRRESLASVNPEHLQSSMLRLLAAREQEARLQLALADVESE
jgi:uncharacterized protein YcbX